MYSRVSPNDWKDKSLYDLAEWKNGLAFKNIKFSDSGMPVIKIAELKAGIGAQTKFTHDKFDSSVLVSEGDMLFSWSGNPDTSIDVFLWEGNPGWLNQHIFKVTPADNVDFDFLFFKLMWLKPRFAAIARDKQTTGLGHVTKQNMRDLRVGIPSPDEQKKIVDAIKPFHDKIRLNRQMNAKLEAMAQAIFKDWFVDFGPTVRKSEGETDSVKILGGLIPDPANAANIVALFPDSFNDHGLPQGWATQTLRDILDLNYGKSLPKKTRVAGEFPVYGSGGVTGSHNDFLVTGPSIIIGRKGTVGSLYWEPNNFFPIDTVFYVVPKNAYTLSFIWPLLQTLGLNKMNTDAAVPGLNRNNAYRLEIPKPSNEVLQAFEKIVFPLRQKIDAIDKENQTLAETRDYLLPKLMSGEVRVGEAAPAATETSNVVTMGGDLFDRKVLPADKDLERDSAIVAGVVLALQKDTEVVGNVKYQKGCYFVYRRMGYSTRDFDRKAAGPYSRKIVEGGHARAVSQNYIRFKSDPNYPGNLPARNIRTANALANQYKLGDALAWVRQHLSGKNRSELELWATVDYAMVALRNRRMTPTADSVMDYIRNEPEWAAKLKKANFTKPKINAAIAELNKAFPNG